MDSRVDHSLIKGCFDGACRSLTVAVVQDAATMNLRRFCELGPGGAAEGSLNPCRCRSWPEPHPHRPEAPKPSRSGGASRLPSGQDCELGPTEADRPQSLSSLTSNNLLLYDRDGPEVLDSMVVRNTPRMVVVRSSCSS